MRKGPLPARRCRRSSRALGLFGGAVLLSWLAPVPAHSFFQQTTLEGALGTDIGGVWLAVHQIMPEFRSTFPKPAEGPPLPFKVGPIPADLEPLVGKNPEGVSVAEMTDPARCADLGIMVGDIIVRVNSAEITDQASYDAAVTNLPQQVLLSIRRPAIGMTTVRLLKIKYAATAAADEGSSSVGVENLDIRVLEAALPFADKVEDTRKTHQFWQPTEEDLKGLREKWFELPPRDPIIFTKGSHRVVAASNFDESLSSDKGLAKAKFAVLMDLEGNPMRGGGKSIDIYGVETADKDSMTGTFVTATIATAPFPINVEFKGRFRMVRLADWSDQDDKFRAAKQPTKPSEDLKKYELAPDVPPAQPAKP